MDDLEEEAVRVKKISPQKSHTIIGVIMRICVSLITMVLLLWAIYSGFRLATLHPSKHVKHTIWAFRVGVLTMVVGFMFLLLGIPILADLVLNLSDQLQEDAGVHKELLLAAWETMKASKATAAVFANVITVIVFWWAIYIGFRLATEPSNGTYLFLTTSIGMLTITFGSIYFIIGMNIIAKLGIDLFDQLQQKKREETLLLSRLKE